MSNVINFKKTNLERELSEIMDKLDCDAVAILAFKKRKDGFFSPCSTNFGSRENAINNQIATSMLLNVINNLIWGGESVWSE